MPATAELELTKFAIVPHASSPAPTERDEWSYLWEPPPWTISDPKEQIVEGYASLPNLDDQGDVIPIDVINRAMPDYMIWGNLREMHEKNAVGKTIEAKVDHRGVWVVCKIVDPLSWNKVRTGVLQGFSIGGKPTSIETRADGVRVITGLELGEISLVDRPANSECRISVVKASELEKPAESEAQRRWAFGAKGEDWAREHHFDNPGKLPTRKAEDKEAASATSSFAYTDSSGKGHLPIGDAAHVRNALARFNQTHFESKEKADAAWAKIKAAARRFGIDSEADKPKAETGKKPSSGYTKTQKGITTMDLEKVKASLSDPQDLEVAEQFEKVLEKNGIEKGAWGGTSTETPSKPPMGIDIDDDDNTAEFLKSVGASDEEENEDREDDGEAKPPKAEKASDDTEKASDGMGSAKECAKHLAACYKSFEADHPGKAHAMKAMKAFQRMHKAFGKSSQPVSKSWFRPDPGVFVTEAELEKALVPLYNSVKTLANGVGALRSQIDNLPLPKTRPPMPVNRDDEASRYARY